MVRLQKTSNYHLLSQCCRPFVWNSADVWNQYVKMTPKARSQKKKFQFLSSFLMALF